MFYNKVKPNPFHPSDHHNNNNNNNNNTNKRIKETQETLCNIVSGKRFSRNAIMGGDTTTKMDNFKKQQCFVTLKRLMIHPDGKDFKNAMGATKPLMQFETLKSKLEKNLYLTTDQFARDVRILLGNAILLFKADREIRRITMKLGELFELKWKSLEEKWAAEKQQNKEQKPKEIVTKVCGSMTETRRNKRKSECDILEENKCPNTMKEVDFDAKLTTQKKAKDISMKPEKHFLDTILASQKNMYGCNDVSLERKKQSENSRVMVQKIKRTVFIDDNLKSFRELERLCGRSLEDHYKVNPLKEFFGLVLKDEFMEVTDLNEEKFLNRDWEDGEIIVVD